MFESATQFKRFPTYEHTGYRLCSSGSGYAGECCCEGIDGYSILPMDCLPPGLWDKLPYRAKATVTNPPYEDLSALYNDIMLAGTRLNDVREDCDTRVDPFAPSCIFVDLNAGFLEVYPSSSSVLEDLCYAISDKYSPGFAPVHVKHELAAMLDVCGDGGEEPVSPSSSSSSGPPEPPASSSNSSGSPEPPASSSTSAAPEPSSSASPEPDRSSGSSELGSSSSISSGSSSSEPSSSSSSSSSGASSSAAFDAGYYCMCHVYTMFGCTVAMLGVRGCYRYDTQAAYEASLLCVPGMEQYNVFLSFNGEDATCGGGACVPGSGCSER